MMLPGPGRVPLAGGVRRGRLPVPGRIGSVTLHPPANLGRRVLEVYRGSEEFEHMRRLVRTRSESVCTVMPGSALREQAGTSVREPSTSTTHTRQTLTGSRFSR